MDQQNTPSKDLLTCTDDKCIDDQDKYIISCKKCSRKIHYRCTQLPAYQIQVYLKYKSIKYICQACVKPTENLIDMLPTKTRPIPRFTVKKIDRVKSDVKSGLTRRPFQPTKNTSFRCPFNVILTH